MHESSFNHMQAVVGAHLTGQDQLRIADIGSYDVNGSYRPLFDRHGWTYIGVDQTAGPNVDAVLDTPYILPFPDNSLDVIVSGQAFEHVEFFWILFEEMARCLKIGGYIVLIAPSKGPEHHYPVDCWRFYPDGYRALAKWGGLTLISVQTDLEDPTSEWGDTVGVFRKAPAWKPWSPTGNRLAELSEEVERVTRERDFVLQSTSWKLTAPLRAAVTWVRQIVTKA
jgi:SAM-dependent methyltransferase